MVRSVWMWVWFMVEALLSSHTLHLFNRHSPLRPHAGINDYVKLALEFAYGADSPALKEKRVAGVQTISGTGACRLAGDFFARFLGKGKPLYLPEPTWCVPL
jgi:aspartate/tyrosine/aromatic aminotransferase